MAGYSDIQSLIDQSVEQKVDALVEAKFEQYKQDMLYNMPVVPYHIHNGIDSPVIPLPAMSNLLATTTTVGFYYIPTTTAAPTGTPTGGAGASIFDKTNSKLYIYTGSAWKSVTLA